MYKDQDNIERRKAEREEEFKALLNYLQGSGIIPSVESKVANIPGATMKITDFIPDDLDPRIMFSPAITILGPKSEWESQTDVSDREYQAQAHSELAIEANNYQGEFGLSVTHWRHVTERRPKEEDRYVLLRRFDAVLPSNPLRQGHELDLALMESGIIAKPDNYATRLQLSMYSTRVRR